MAELNTQYLTIEGASVPLSVRVNPRARKLILKVDPVSGMVILVTPAKRALGEALEFARRQQGWIARQLRQCAPRIPFTPETDIPYLGRLHTIKATGKLRGGVHVPPERAEIAVAGAPDHIERRVTDWLRQQAKATLSARVDHHGTTIGKAARRITIRDTRTRWGSCTAQGALSFSWRLIMAPPDVLDYVAAHEVAHLRHHDHSPAFWSLVRELHPDPGGATRWLKANGTKLHRYGPGA